MATETETYIPVSLRGEGQKCGVLWGAILHFLFCLDSLSDVILLGKTHGVYLPQLGKADLCALPFWNKRREPLGPLQFPLIPIFSGPGSSLT